MNKKRFRKQTEFSTLSYSFENSPLCLATTETGPGPYYLPDCPYRIDVTEGEEGLGLFIGLKIVNAKNCEKIHRARVEIWQANAQGRYSGFPLGSFPMNPQQPKDGSGAGRKATIWGFWNLRQSTRGNTETVPTTFICG